MPNAKSRYVGHADQMKRFLIIDMLIANLLIL